MAAERETPAEAVPTLLGYLDHHLEQKRLDGEARAETNHRDRRRLEVIAEILGNPTLDAINKRAVKRLKMVLQSRGLNPNTVRHYLSALSSLMNTATDEFDAVDANPVRSVKWPKVQASEEHWLESHEGHAMIEAAREVERDPAYRGPRFLKALVATALLTGARRSELFALEVEDVDFNAGLVHFRPNAQYGPRKSRHAVRTVPLWPQLRHILVPYVGDRAGGPLFPMRNGRGPTDLRVSLAKVFETAKVPKPEGKEWHLFRHTYGAMRLQTVEGGKPVALWTVKEELGHGSLGMLERVYGHLLKHRDGQRLEVIEYRPLQADTENAQEARKTA